MLKIFRNEAGDTLIEVLFAITVFSLVMVTSLAIMNQGTAASQRSLETALVTQQINNQAETLRFLHEAYVTNYETGYATNTDLSIDGATGGFYEIVHHVREAGRAQASAFGATDTCPDIPDGSFILNTRTGRMQANEGLFQPAQTYAQQVYGNSPNESVLNNSQGLWIEGIRSVPTTEAATRDTGYIDFHIRACWAGSAGNSHPLTLGTIVRLYEPRG